MDSHEVTEGSTRCCVLPRVFQSSRNVDADLGNEVEEGVRANLDGNGA